MQWQTGKHENAMLIFIWFKLHVLLHLEEMPSKTDRCSRSQQDSSFVTTKLIRLAPVRTSQTDFGDKFSAQRGLPDWGKHINTDIKSDSQSGSCRRFSRTETETLADKCHTLDCCIGIIIIQCKKKKKRKSDSSGFPYRWVLLKQEEKKIKKGIHLWWVMEGNAKQQSQTAQI